MRWLIAALAFWLACTSPVAAQSLDDAKAQGLIGERADGYLAVVDDAAPAGVKAMVDDVNAKRRASYEKIAQSRGVPVEAVGQIAAKKVFESAPPGTYLRDPSGQWMRK